jgi:arylsulfatase A-like enzyme
VIVLASDHGELLGAHGLYMKNTGAFEEVYGIPMVLSGPGIARGAVTDARVGLHDLCPTLCELGGAEPISNGQSRSIVPLLREPATHEGDFRTGYAEYYGTRYWLTQRVVWDGPWKLVFNGFDDDELYNLENDPYELRNLAGDERYRDEHRRMMARLWQIARETGDAPLLGANYPAIRYAEIGPGAAIFPGGSQMPGGT